jgi:hypothetical protein
MHMPNPNLLRVSVGSGPDAIPRSLVDLVSDCGSYSPDQRPSMREVNATQHTTQHVLFLPAWLLARPLLEKL